MGQSKRRRSGLGQCIYCGLTDDLTDEHVLPYALGGHLVLNQASCKACATITGKLEQKLLRGHWWPYRKKLGLQTRNPDASKELKRVKITKTDGTIIDAEMPLESFVAAMVFKLDPPAILLGNEASGEPFAKNAFLKMLGAMPTEAIVDGKRYLIAPHDNVEFPVNFASGDLTRFLAKVAHSYTVPKFQPVVLENGIEQDIERKDFAVIDPVPHLPANRAVRMKQPNSLGDSSRLLLNVNLI